MRQIAQHLAGRRVYLKPVACIAAVKRAQPALAFDDGVAVAKALVGAWLVQRGLAGVGTGEQQGIGHIGAAAGIGLLLRQQMPAERLQHRHDQFDLGLRLVEGGVAANVGVDALQLFGESSELHRVQVPPRRGAADALLDEVLGKQGAVHGGPMRKSAGMVNDGFWVLCYTTAEVSVV